MGNAETFHRQSVDQRDIGLHRHGNQCLFHRQVGGAEDVEPIDLLRADHPDGPDDGGVSGNFLIKQVTAFFRELLGVVQERARKRPREDDRRGCNRSRQRPSSRLVNACNPTETAGCKDVLEGEIRHAH